MRATAPLAGAILILFMASGCATQNAGSLNRSPTTGAPILLIGLDGFEWNLVLRMLNQGGLPNLRSLMERGSFGMLNTLHPTISPAIWTSIATGKVPRKHGITRFIHPATRDRMPRLYTNCDRKTKAFWNILSDHGRTVFCIGWWMTFPVEPIHGVMVAQTNTLPDKADRRGWKGSVVPGLDGQVFPPVRQRELLGIVSQAEERMPEQMTLLFGKPGFSGEGRFADQLRVCEWAFRADLTYETLAINMLKESGTPDLLAVYLGGPDVVGHRFWKYVEPDGLSAPPSEEELHNFGGVVPAYYTHADSFIGRLLQLCREDCTVIIVSDHGMHLVPRSGPQALSGGHADAPPAFMTAAGTNIRKMNSMGGIPGSRPDLKTLGSILDVMPTILRLEGIPFGLDMDGKAMEGILEPAFIASVQPTSVQTHDTSEWLASRPRLQPGGDLDAERLDQLRALGYID